MNEIVLLKDKDSFDHSCNAAAGVATAINMRLHGLKRNGDLEDLKLVERMYKQMGEQIAHLRKLVDCKESFDQGYTVGHTQGFMVGENSGYEKGVADTHREHPHLASYLDQVAKNGGGLVFIKVGGAHEASDR